jgi:hypothetical protein
MCLVCNRPFDYARNGKRFGMKLNIVGKCKETKGLIWFRNDLRVHDNESLFNAVENNESVIAVYCFDPRHFESRFGFKKQKNSELNSNRISSRTKIEFVEIKYSAFSPF